VPPISGFRNGWDVPDASGGRMGLRTPVKAEVRKAIGKEAGDSLTIQLNERLEG
jgi:hypothetical protein